MESDTHDIYNHQTIEFDKPETCNNKSLSAEGLLQLQTILSYVKKDYINVDKDKKTWIKQVDDSAAPVVTNPIVNNNAFLDIYIVLLISYSCIRYVKYAIDVIYSDNFKNVQIKNHPRYTLGRSYFVEAIEAVNTMMGELLSAQINLIKLYLRSISNDSIHANLNKMHHNFINKKKDSLKHIPKEQYKTVFKNFNTEIYCKILDLLTPCNFIDLSERLHYLFFRIKMNTYIKKLVTNSEDPENFGFQIDFTHCHFTFNIVHPNNYNTIPSDNTENHMIYINSIDNEYVRVWWTQLINVINVANVINKATASNSKDPKKTWLTIPEKNTHLKYINCSNYSLMDVFITLIKYNYYVSIIKRGIDIMYSDSFECDEIKNHPNYKLGYTYFIGALDAIQTMINDLIVANKYINKKKFNSLINKETIQERIMNAHKGIYQDAKKSIDNIQIHNRVHFLERYNIGLYISILECIIPCNYYNMCGYMNRFVDLYIKIKYLKNLIKGNENPYVVKNKIILLDSYFN
jgi:hypothetical protein